MKVFVALVLVLVVFTVCDATKWGKRHHGDDDKHDSQQKNKYVILSEAFLEYVTKETDHVTKNDVKRCHLQESLHDIISNSKESINKALLFIYTRVTSVLQEFLFRIRYEIDHVIVHTASFVRALKINLYSIPDELESKLQSKLHSLKKEAEHHSKKKDFEGLRKIVIVKIKDMKEDVEKDVKPHRYVHYQKDKDLKKELEDCLENLKDRLMEMTKSYEKKVHSCVSHQKPGKDDDKKGKTKWRPSFSCKALRDKLDDLWDSFCKSH